MESLPDNEIKAAMQSLPEQFRIAVNYADVEGFRCKEIAAIMNIPHGTVMSRASTADASNCEANWARAI